MKASITFLVIAGALATFSKAQQAPPPQPAQTQNTATNAPCSPTTPDKPHKQGWLEKKARALACKQNKNLCDLPSSVDDATGTTTSQKPCKADPAPKPQTPVAPAQQTPREPNTKPTYVCPPKSTLIPNYPYCIYADHTVVDAIPLPPTQPAAPQHWNGTGRHSISPPNPISKRDSDGQRSDSRHDNSSIFPIRLLDLP